MVFVMGPDVEESSPVVVVALQNVGRPARMQVRYAKSHRVVGSQWPGSVAPAHSMQGRHAKSA